MKMKKKIASLLAAVTLMSSVTVPSFAATSTFSDVSSNSWYAAAVNTVAAHNLVNGIGNNKFGPDLGMTRAQMVQILYNKEGNPAVSGNSSYTDVLSSAWYYRAVQWATQNGIVSGVGNNQFDPESFITREQYAAILYRFYEKTTGESPLVNMQVLKNYSDQSSISGWAGTAMAWAVTNGIMSGTDTGTLIPRHTTTRAQGAQMLANYLDKTNGHSYIIKTNKEATCTEAGEKVSTCSVCGKTNTETFPATGHNYTTDVLEETTCLTAGSIKYTCTNCNYTYTETTPALGHNWTKQYNSQNIIVDYKCTNCNTTYTGEVINLVNAERAENNLSPLKLNQSAAAAASVRAVELNQVFSHYRPDGTLCFTALDEQNVTYYGAGENIAAGQDDPQEVMTAWMNSEGHRSNILGNFTAIGVGYASISGTPYWVQMFIR